MISCAIGGIAAALLQRTKTDNTFGKVVGVPLIAAGVGGIAHTLIIGFKGCDSLDLMR